MTSWFWILNNVFGATDFASTIWNMGYISQFYLSIISVWIISTLLIYGLVWLIGKVWDVNIFNQI